jgi:CheY-like chemotaxis protein
MEEPAADNRALRILIADDSSSDRLILKFLLIRLGHEVVEASDGLEAVARFEETAPDMVLMDALMPKMDGMEATRQIKALESDRLVPVIFLTSLTEATELARCLESGGDGFLTKPYNQIMLRAQIYAFNRMRRMQRTLSEQRDIIAERNQQLLEEQEVAKRVFDNVAHTGCLGAANIRYHASPLSIFNGDVLFASLRPAGGMLVFIGDFTGHGLPAAIGAMPVAEIFYGMASKGFNGADILKELNQKLKRILPSGMFCCGAMIEADFKRNQLLVWNGGLPDGWLAHLSGERRALPSRHLPLGIRNAEQFDAGMDVINTRPGDRILMMSDGIPEARNQAGEAFGEAGIVRALDEQRQKQHPFDAVMESIRQFTGQHGGDDDLTLLCLEMVDEADFSTVRDQDGVSGRATQSALSGPGEWHCVYEIRERSLSTFNPLPLLLHICMEVPGLRRKSGEVYTLLTELYSNALEHGVLGLPTEWKQTPEGFDRYYQERQQRLHLVDGHFVRFSLYHSLKPSGGRLRIVCEDSGVGFDFINHPVLADCDPPVTTRNYGGRGLLLLKRLSESLVFHEPGNRVEIVYDWHMPEATHEPA